MRHKRGKAKDTIYSTLRSIKAKGFSIEKWIKYREVKSKKKIDKEIEKKSNFL